MNTETLAAAAPSAPAEKEILTADIDPALPSIEPPRSWSKEDKELFASLPRELQERLADRERSREADFLRRQHQLVEARKEYEQKLQTLTAFGYVTEEQRAAFGEYAKREALVLKAKFPALDLGKLRQAAAHLLKRLGFEDDELSQLWDGRQFLSLRDHRVQMLFIEALTRKPSL
jgi:hypothetical protein